MSYYLVRNIPCSTGLLRQCVVFELASVCVGGVLGPASGVQPPTGIETPIVDDITRECQLPSLNHGQKIPPEGLLNKRAIARGQGRGSRLCQ